jgi:hypothetical protein
LSCALLCTCSDNFLNSFPNWGWGKGLKRLLLMSTLLLNKDFKLYTGLISTISLGKGTWFVIIRFAPVAVGAELRRHLLGQRHRDQRDVPVRLESQPLGRKFCGQIQKQFTLEACRSVPRLGTRNNNANQATKNRGPFLMAPLGPNFDP